MTKYKLEQCVGGGTTEIWYRLICVLSYRLIYVLSNWNNYTQLRATLRRSYGLPIYLYMVPMYLCTYVPRYDLALTI